MKRHHVMILAALGIFLSSVFASAAVLDDLLLKYQKTSGTALSATAGETLWKEKHPQAAGAPSRSCASCHGDNLRQTGKHEKTGKKIDAMAPSVNAKRLTDAVFIEKWFKRNCQWTWGRECTPTEKGQLLMFLKNQ